MSLAGPMVYMLFVSQLFSHKPPCQLEPIMVAMLRGWFSTFYMIFVSFRNSKWLLGQLCFLYGLEIHVGPISDKFPIWKIFWNYFFRYYCYIWQLSLLKYSLDCALSKDFCCWVNQKFKMAAATFILFSQFFYFIQSVQ